MSNSNSYLETVALNAPIPRGSRGRNGVFTARSLQVYARPADGGNAALVDISVSSARTGNQPPIALGLSLEDALILGHELIKAVGHIVRQSAEEVSHAENIPA